MCSGYFSVGHPLKIKKRACFTSSLITRCTCYNNIASQEMIVKTIKIKLSGNYLNMLSAIILLQWMVEEHTKLSICWETVLSLQIK